MEQECWKQRCLSLSQQREVSYLIWLHTPTSSQSCLSPLAVIRGMQDVCDHAVSLHLSSTPNIVEGIGWFQLNWRNRQKFQDTKFLRAANSVGIRHWKICREETVKCHPASQGAASVSLCLYENRFYGLSKNIFCSSKQKEHFSTEINCKTLIPTPSPSSSARPITTSKRQETLWAPHAASQ